jgi:thioesterase domain-containing protein
MPQTPSAEDPAALTNAGRASDAAHAALWSGILGVADHLNNKPPRAGARRPVVMALRDDGAAVPLYFIGNGLAEFNLAHAINFDRPIFGVEIPWPATWRDLIEDGETEGLPSLPQLVAPYAAAIAAHLGTGHCALAGYSFAGLMAFEAAHQLGARGIAVDAIMLLDAPAAYPSSHQFAWQKLREIWRRPRLPSHGQAASSIIARLGRSCAAICWMLADKIKGRGLSIAELIKPSPAPITTQVDDLGRPLPWPMIEQLYDNTLVSYRLRRLDCRGVLFRAVSREGCPARMFDRHLGWDNLLGGGLDVVDVSGNHLSMMREPQHVATLGSAIGEWLSRSRAGAASVPPPRP